MASQKVKIVWSRRATRHLHASYDYWSSEKSEAAADAMLERIFSAVEMLETHPDVGRLGRVPGTRELVLAPMPFLLAYRIRGNKLEVLALLHGARKWPSGF